MTPIREKITEMFHTFNPEGGNTATSPAAPATNTENSKAPGRKLKIGRNVALAIAGIVLSVGAYHAPAMVDTHWIGATKAYRLLLGAGMAVALPGWITLVVSALTGNKTGVIAGLTMFGMTVAMITSPHMQNLDLAASATRIAQSIDRGSFPETQVPASVNAMARQWETRREHHAQLKKYSKLLTITDPGRVMDTAEDAMFAGMPDLARRISRDGIVTEGELRTIQARKQRERVKNRAELMEMDAPRVTKIQAMHQTPLKQGELRHGAGNRTKDTDRTTMAKQDTAPGDQP